MNSLSSFLIQFFEPDPREKKLFPIQYTLLHTIDSNVLVMELRILSENG